MTEAITFEQMEAPFDKKLAPLKEAIASMEAKLGDHDVSLEDATRRPEALEAAPALTQIDKKVKSATSIVENRIAVKYEAKMVEVNETNEANSKHLIEQLLAAYSSSTKGGSFISENRTLIDTDISGSAPVYNPATIFRKPHGVYAGNALLAHIAEHPFSSSCDTRGQIENLFKMLNFQDKGIFQAYNSFLEYRFGINFHKSCLEWAISHTLSRPHLANIEIKDVRYLFID